jgi:hypothetical protein
MNDDFDLDRLGEVPDPLANVGDWPLPPRRESAAVLPSPPRSRVHGLRAAALAAAIVYELLWIAIMNKREDLGTMPRAMLVLEAATPLAAAGLALAGAAGTGRHGLGESKGRLLMLLSAAPALFVAVTVLTSPVTYDPLPFWFHVARCFAWTSLYAVGPLLLGGWAFRRSFVVGASWRAAAVGLAAGAAGTATMSFVCSDGTPSHVLLGHGGTMLAGALIGALVGRKLGEP